MVPTGSSITDCALMHIAIRRGFRLQANFLTLSCLSTKIESMGIRIRKVWIASHGLIQRAEPSGRASRSPRRRSLLVLARRTRSARVEPRSRFTSTNSCIRLFVRVERAVGTSQIEGLFEFCLLLVVLPEALLGFINGRPRFEERGL